MSIPRNGTRVAPYRVNVGNDPCVIQAVSGKRRAASLFFVRQPHVFLIVKKAFRSAQPPE